MNTLSSIIAYARAGALDHAWARFGEAGYDRCNDDPAALTVKGRLLKDFALRSTRSEDRRRFFLQAAEAYQRSAALRPGTYPLINAATLSLLSGDRHRASETAREVLDRLAREPEEPETPYWRAATEAEALLLLGRPADASAAISAALIAAPRAWEDHASTLRQFLEIERALGENYLWLERLRAPLSIHYGAFNGTDFGESGAMLAQLNGQAGFGFGSLASTAEICAAEALLRSGAQLHVILPSSPGGFAARFIDGMGADWRARFDAALADAATVRFVRPLEGQPSDAAVALAEAIAWGAARLNAEELMGDAIRLGGELPANRSGLALLALRLAAGRPTALQDRLADVRTAFDAVAAPTLSPHLSGDLVLAGYADVEVAAGVARSLYDALQDRFPIQLAAHYGLIDCVCDPFSGASRPTGSGPAIVQAIAGAAPPSTICVSDDFAAVLAATTGRPREVSRIGEIQALDGGPAIGLYALNRAPS